MNEILIKAIEDFSKATATFTKFIAPNDTDATGAHQAGIYINKNAWNLFFDAPGRKGELKDIFITIRWQDDFETSSRFVYYGSKNEYRITQFGKKFPFLKEENVGDLLILFKYPDRYYKAYILTTDEEIEHFLYSTGIGITETNKLFNRAIEDDPKDLIARLISEFVSKHLKFFPPSKEISQITRTLFFQAFKETESIAIKNADQTLVDWINLEYTLFKALENRFSSGLISKGFETVDDFIVAANTLLNRRKSRAGKALENHLASIFDINKVQYETNVKTEGNKKPDFIFPDGKAYHDVSFNINNLFCLAAKTTCKDRWRQILNEADKIKTKHLITLQQGISKNQLLEMKSHNVVLIVPDVYQKFFPKEFLSDILSVSEFINMVKSTHKY